MRIEIKTNGKINDTDLKALFILNHALLISSERMRKANLDFILDKWGYERAIKKGKLWASQR